MTRPGSWLFWRTWLLYSALLGLLMLTVEASRQHAPRRQAYVRNVLR